MNRLSVCRACLHRNWSRIHLVDRCLILFMLILLAQSAFTLATGGDASGSNDIDVIVRTSAAAIFGYFMSANFIHRTAPDGSQSDTGNMPQRLTGETHVEPNAPQNRIGFSASAGGPEPGPGGAKGSLNTQKSPRGTAENRLQVIIVTAVGFFCLITLIAVRNIGGRSDAVTFDPSTAATVAQFRDFVSGCVGFLIGCSTADKENAP